MDWTTTSLAHHNLLVARAKSQKGKVCAVKMRRAIIVAISALSTLFGCVSLPCLVVAYYVDGDILSLLRGKCAIPAWYLLLLMFLLLLVMAIAIGLWLTRGVSKKEAFNCASDVSDPQLDQQLIRDYMLRVKGILGNGCSYSESQIRRRLKLPEFKEQHYICLQQAIGRLVDEGTLVPSKLSGRYQLAKEKTLNKNSHKEKCGWQVK